MDGVRYFDHAATTKLDEQVLNEMLPYLYENYGNASSLYSIGRIAKEGILLSKMRIAASINSKTNEIYYFTSCGSESDNLAIKGIAMANSRFGNHIITSKIEHPAVLNSCKSLEKIGYRVTYLPVDEYGLIHLEDLERAITKETILVSIMHTNNEIGSLQPVFEAGVVIKRKNPNTLFHVDAVQGYGKFRILPKTILRAATLIFAVLSTIHGLFPPSSRLTGVRCAAAFSITRRPTLGPPVKKI